MNKLPIDQISNKLSEIGLSLDNQPVSFGLFKRKAVAEGYGRRPFIYVIYVGHRDNRFGFYPPKTNKVESLKIAYEYYKDLFTPMKQEWLDGNVKWGNCGIPLAYGALRTQL